MYYLELNFQYFANLINIFIPTVDIITILMKIEYIKTKSHQCKQYE